MCGRGITNYRNVSGLSIRVSPSHPYNAGRAGLGWGGVGWLLGNVYAACSGCVVGLALGDMDSCQDVPQYKVMKYLVFETI